MEFWISNPTFKLQGQLSNFNLSWLCNTMISFIISGLKQHKSNYELASALYLSEVCTVDAGYKHTSVSVLRSERNHFTASETPGQHLHWKSSIHSDFFLFDGNFPETSKFKTSDWMQRLTSSTLNHFRNSSIQELHPPGPGLLLEAVFLRVRLSLSLPVWPQCCRTTTLCACVSFQSLTAVEQQNKGSIENQLRVLLRPVHGPPDVTAVIQVFYSWHTSNIYIILYIYIYTCVLVHVVYIHRFRCAHT